jgi:hypothetical protein
MSIRETIKSQYYASLEMLKQAIVNCPPALWTDQGYENKFWHIAYHALFFTHLYLQSSEEDFAPWNKHKDQYRSLGSLPEPAHKEPDIEEPYTKEEILEYLRFCQAQVDEKVDSLNLDAESGFYWLPFGKIELQFYNIRHIQHHTGELYERLGTRENVRVEWVGKKPD